MHCAQLSSALLSNILHSVPHTLLPRPRTLLHKLGLRIVRTAAVAGTGQGYHPEHSRCLEGREKLGTESVRKEANIEMTAVNGI